MSKKKLIAGLLLASLVLISLTGTVLAAANPGSLVATTTTIPAPITGKLQSATIQTDSNNVTTVVVTLLDANNVQQTVTLSLADAVTLGVVTLDANNVPAVNQTLIGQTITVQPPTPTPTPTSTAQNPVGALIAGFFGLDNATVNGFHQDGSGYGVIAQACWMSVELKGDASMCADILKTKKTGDYSAIVLPDGSTASNWGQFKKAVSLQNKSMENLGAIISGRATPLPTTTPTVTVTPPTVTILQSGAENSNNGNGNGQGNGNNGTGNGHGNGHGNGNGNGNGHGNGKGPNK